MPFVVLLLHASAPIIPGMEKSEGEKRLTKMKTKKSKAANKVGKSCTCYSGGIC